MVESEWTPLSVRDDLDHPTLVKSETFSREMPPVAQMASLMTVSS